MKTLFPRGFILSPLKEHRFFLKTVFQDFQNSPLFQRAACVYMTITGDFPRFQYFNAETNRDKQSLKQTSFKANTVKVLIDHMQFTISTFISWFWKSTEIPKFLFIFRFSRKRSLNAFGYLLFLYFDINYATWNMFASYKFIVSILWIRGLEKVNHRIIMKTMKGR